MKIEPIQNSPFWAVGFARASALWWMVVCTGGCATEREPVQTGVSAAALQTEDAERLGVLLPADGAATSIVDAVDASTTPAGPFSVPVLAPSVADTPDAEPLAVTAEPPEEESGTSLSPDELRSRLVVEQADALRRAPCAVEGEILRIEGRLKVFAVGRATTELPFDTAVLRIAAVAGPDCPVRRDQEVEVEYPVHAHSWILEPGRSYLLALREDAGRVLPFLDLPLPSVELQDGVAPVLDASFDTLARRTWGN